MFVEELIIVYSMRINQYSVVYIINLEIIHLIKEDNAL